MFKINEYTAEKLKDPFGLLTGDRYEFQLFIEVDEDDELYTDSDIGVKLVFVVDGENQFIAQSHFFEVTSNDILDFELEDEEIDIVKAFCAEHLPKDEE